MIALQEEYSTLVALTQLFILREFSRGEKVMTDGDSYAFFHKEQIASASSRQITPPLVTKSIKSSAVQEVPLKTTPPVPQPSVKSVPQVKAPPAAVSDALPPPKSSPSKAPLFNLEPLSPPTPVNCQEFKAIIKAHFAHFPFSESIPSDHLAKKVKNQWQVESIIPPVIILSFNEQEKPLAFLNNLAHAISRHFAPAKVLPSLKIEQEKRWDSILKAPGLRLVIASDYGLYLLPELMKHYKEASRQAKHYLNQTPLLLLSDLSLYLKQPPLKPLLWRAICSELKNPK